MTAINNILCSLGHLLWKKGMGRERKERIEEEKKEDQLSGLSRWTCQGSQPLPWENVNPHCLEPDFLAIHSNSPGIVITAFEANPANCLSLRAKNGSHFLKCLHFKWSDKYFINISNLAYLDTKPKFLYWVQWCTAVIVTLGGRARIMP